MYMRRDEHNGIASVESPRDIHLRFIMMIVIIVGQHCLLNGKHGYNHIGITRGGGEGSTTLNDSVAKIRGGYGLLHQFSSLYVLKLNVI